MENLMITMSTRRVMSISLLMTLLLLASPSQAQTQRPDCTPGVSFWSLLDSVAVEYTSGILRLDKLYAVCLPAAVRQSPSNYPYDPDGGGKLSTLLKTADGKLLSTYVWYASSIGGLWEMSRYKVLGGFESIKPLTAGNYLLEFAIEDKPFYRFPFSVVQIKSADPYQAAGNRYFIEGAWNEYGNLFYQRNDPQQSLQFTTWVQEKSGKLEKKSVPYELKLINSKSGRVLGEESGTLRLEPRWLRARLSLRPAGGDKNSYLKAVELLQEDGRYNVRLLIDGKVYGDYPFVVQGGQLQFQGKQVREKTDPMVYIVDYLSGGRYSSWWSSRQLASK